MRLSWDRHTILQANSDKQKCHFKVFNYKKQSDFVTSFFSVQSFHNIFLTSGFCHYKMIWPTGSWLPRIQVIAPRPGRSHGKGLPRQQPGHVPVLRPKHRGVRLVGRVARRETVGVWVLFRSLVICCVSFYENTCAKKWCEQSIIAYYSICLMVSCTGHFDGWICHAASTLKER